MARSNPAPPAPHSGPSDDSSLEAIPSPASWQKRVGVVIAVAAACVLGAMTMVTVHTIEGHLAALHPRRTPINRANAAELGEISDVSFVTSDGLTIRGWYHPSKNRAAVIVTHGGGGSRQQVLPEATMFARHGYGVLVFDWRAHGESDGDTCTWGGLEQRDLEAAIDFMVQRPDVDPERIGALGFSFGGGPVIEVAAADPRLKAVVTEGTTPTLFERIKLDSGRFRWFTGLPSVFAVGRKISLDAARPVDHVCAIHPRPILIISGDDDTDQPEWLAREIYDAACDPKEFWRVKGAAHGQYMKVAPVEYERRVVGIFDGALLGNRP